MFINLNSDIYIIYTVGSKNTTQIKKYIFKNIKKSKYLRTKLIIQ